MEKIKKPRITTDGSNYKTGDAQTWTYEYTAEDFERAIVPYAGANEEVGKIRRQIFDHFRNNKNVLIEAGYDEKYIDECLAEHGPSATY